MNPMKHFVCAVLAVSLVLLASLAALVVLVDPFFQFHTPGDAEVFENERYENPGMIRNLEYDTVLMGTSLVCNYRASWFDELTGGQTIKIAYRDGYLSDFDTALSLAFRTHPDIRAVYFGLDANILVRSDAERTVDLPGWLYDDNPLNDVQYFLNKDVYLECLNVLWQRRQGNTRALDDAYVWDGDYIFSAWQAISTYERPERSETQLPADAYYEAVDENLAVVDRWATEHPDVEFTIFFSPYSILYWDRTIREGKLEAMLSALDYAVQKLLEYDNIKVHFFMGREQIITDLGNYTDHIHCSGVIDRQLSEWMMGEAFLLTWDNYRHYLDHLREVVTGYDYEGLFAQHAG